MLIDLVESDEGRDREFAKLVGLAFIEALAVFGLGSPALRQAYLKSLAEESDELRRYLTTIIMTDLALPGYLDAVEEYLAIARNVLPVLLLNGRLDSILSLRPLTGEERERILTVRKQVRRKLRSARAYLKGVFAPIHELTRGQRLGGS